MRPFSRINPKSSAKQFLHLEPISINLFRNFLYRNGLKNRDYDEEAAQIFGLERETIAEWQGSSENRKFAAKPTPGSPMTHRHWGGALSETDSSDYFGIALFGAFLSSVRRLPYSGMPPPSDKNPQKKHLKSSRKSLLR